MKNNLIYLISFIIILFSISCSKTSAPEADTEVNDSIIVISKAQFSSENMQLGKIENTNFERKISVKGKLIASANGKAHISSLVSGTIQSVAYTQGQQVQKGAVICTLKSNEGILLQQDFSEAAQLLKGSTTDYNRAKALYEQKLLSEKEFTAVESSYKTILARYEGLKARLQLLDINLSQLESGKISPYIQILAPISGFISRQNCTLGMYAEPGNVLMEIVDIGNLQVELYVFEKDIPNLSIGQKVFFKHLDSNGTKANATLQYIGRSVDADNKAVSCIAKISDSQKLSLTEGMYVDAEVVLSTANLPALPGEAFLKGEEEVFVLVKEKEDDTNYYFKKQIAKTGYNNIQYTEIQNADTTQLYLVKGVYNIVLE